MAFLVMSSGNLVGILVAPKRRGGLANGARVVIALALGGAAVVSPLWLPRDWAIVRTIFAFAFGAGFYRIIAVVRRPDGRTMASRALSVILPVVDARRLLRVPRTFRIGSVAIAAVEAVIAWLLFERVAAWPPTAPYAGVASVMRVLVGGASMYMIVQSCARSLEALLAALGIDAGNFHDAPIFARSVSEFWGKRWNRAVSLWLSDNAFRPIASRAGVAAGVMAAFVASALLHFVPIWVANGFHNAWVMATFFLLHGVIVLVESKLHVSRWPRAFGHVWTLAIFAATAPIFVEPMLEALGR